MDKYEFNIKVEQIKKLVAKGDYETAMKIADTIDWRRDGAQAILDRVFRDPQAGDMILMHPVKETAEVLGEIIDGLRERGLEPCRVSDVVNIK